MWECVGSWCGSVWVAGVGVCGWLVWGIVVYNWCEQLVWVADVGVWACII